MYVAFFLYQKNADLYRYKNNIIFAIFPNSLTYLGIYRQGLYIFKQSS